MRKDLAGECGDLSWLHLVADPCLAPAHRSAAQAAKAVSARNKAAAAATAAAVAEPQDQQDAEMAETNEVVNAAESS